MGYGRRNGCSALPHLRLTDAAIADISRLRRFLIDKNPRAAQRAVAAIRERLVAVNETPQAGRPLPNLDPFRETLIPFGDGGYLARYRYDGSTDTVYVVAIRHQRESGST